MIAAYSFFLDKKIERCWQKHPIQQFVNTKIKEIMTKKGYLKQSIISVGIISLVLFTVGCSKKETVTPNSFVIDGNTNCLALPSEETGSFPTRNPSLLVMEDIKGDRQGVSMTINLLIANSNNNCAAIENAKVDIWYADAAGNYSQYTFHSSQDFLRGRQPTNKEGRVKFQGIFPGWYKGRAPHIHLKVSDKDDNSLLVTQIAFPKNICDDVYTTATNFYKNGKQDTINENDEIFQDGSTSQLTKIEGNVSSGYTLTHTIAI